MVVFEGYGISWHIDYGISDIMGYNGIYDLIKGILYIGVFEHRMHPHNGTQTWGI